MSLPPPGGLLGPAVRIMNRLSYPRKFLLISFFFAAPLAVSLGFLLSEIGDRIAFTRKETDGTRYLRPVMRLFQDLARRRNERIPDDLRALEDVDRELGPRLNTAPALDALRRAVAAGNDIETQRRIRTLISQVGNSSNLILDPDLDTYYLMDAVLLKLPEILSLVVGTGRPLSTEERAGLLRAVLDDARAGADVAFANNPSRTLRARLEKPYDEILPRIRDAMDSDRDLALASAFALWDRVVEELDALMHARIAKYEGRRQVAWSSTIVLLGLVGYLWLGFYASVMRTVSVLEDTSQRMLRDEPGAEAALETQDELGRVTASFNAIAQRLRREWTSLKESEDQLRGAKEAAEKANKAKSDFLASMSHELRTPLNSVIGFSTVLLKGRGTRLAEQDAAYLDRILANGKHLLGLINSILDLSKIEAGKAEVRRVPVALDTLLRETLAQLEGRVVDRPLKLVSEIPPGLAPLQTDPDKLKQVLINLLGNALKFTERGAVTARVEAVDDLPVRILVADTGPGIPEEARERIFEAFQQADTGMSRKFEGTGLGLTISRSLCALLGYRLSVHSEVGRGSTFSIHLDDRPVAAGPAAATSDADPSRRLVLVMDDEEDSRLLLRQHLADCGCRTAEAATGVDGLRKAAELKPDLITLDLMMPDMNGWEILRRLKAEPALRGIPVVVVSIVGRENRGTVFGAADLLSKPVSKEELTLVLARNLPSTARRVLAVDDDPAARRLTAQLLADEGLEVELAENGAEALEKLDAFKPDLVLLDLMMPVMDGMGFLAAIRKEPRHAELRVVVLTAKDLTVQELRQLEAGVSTVLRKGADLKADLSDVVRRLLKPGGKSVVKVKRSLAKLIPEFLETRRADVGTLRAAAERGDFETARTLGHNMKGVGSAYGFVPVTEIGRALEAAAKAGDRDAIRRGAEALEDYLGRVETVPE